ncbi:MAG: aldolase/citrate lyase family protein [SAR324 cluster bacterium]|nr:aldolase/citrate lyase family protein [SAR324 cluster bacterium]
MTTIPNKAKERLEKGELALGLGLRQMRGVDIGRILATCGFDFAFIDLEHSTMTIENAAELSVACHDAGVTPLVRVPGYEHYLATRILDAGGMGIVFPHVDTPELAQQLVSNCKYPPMGHRSVAGAMPQLAFQAMPLAESSKLVNQQTMVVIMLETPQAIDNAEAIAAIEGVDVLLVGSNDLCMEMGIPQQFGDAKLHDAIGKVVDACAKHGKHPGLGGVYDEVNAPKFVERGMRFILSGGDLPIFMAGASKRSQFLRGIKY